MPNTSNPDYTVMAAVIGAVIGIIGTLIVDRVKNKLLRLKKRISYQMVGMSAQSETWGDIKITWNGEPYNNLYFFNAEIINDSFKDAPKNLEITFSVEPLCLILKESGSVTHNDISMGLALEENFSKRFQAAREQWFNIPVEERNVNSPIFKDVPYLTTHKKFILPILNRKGIARFDFLIVSNDNKVPILFVGIYEPGISLGWLETEAKKKKRKTWNDILITLLYLGFTFPIIIYSPSITWAAWLMFANSFLSYFFGQGLIYILKILKII